MYTCNPVCEGSVDGGELLESGTGGSSVLSDEVLFYITDYDQTSA